MMHRFAQLTDHAALRSQKAPPPGPLGALSLRVFHSLAFIAFRKRWWCLFHGMGMAKLWRLASEGESSVVGWEAFWERKAAWSAS